MGDTTTIPITCSRCGRACVEGSFFLKDRQALCLDCGVSGMPAPARAFADDLARKQAERLPPPVPPENKEAARKLEALARRLAVTMLERAEKELEPTPEGKTRPLAEVERLVDLARDLDLLADKVFSRGAP